MHKKDVLTAVHIPYDSMEETRYTSRDSSVRSVSGLIPGKCLIIALCTVSTGLSCGPLRVALSSYFVNYPGIASSKSTVLRTIGWHKSLKSKLISLMSSMLSMMLPTFTRMGVY